MAASRKNTAINDIFLLKLCKLNYDCRTIQPLSTRKIAQVKPSKLLTIHWSSGIVCNSTRGNVKRTICKFWQQAICNIRCRPPPSLPPKKLTCWTLKRQNKMPLTVGRQVHLRFPRSFHPQMRPLLVFRAPATVVLTAPLLMARICRWGWMVSKQRNWWTLSIVWWFAASA